MHLPCRSVEFASDEFQTLLVKDCEKNGEYCAPSHLEFTGDLGTVNLHKWAATTLPCNIRVPKSLEALNWRETEAPRHRTPHGRTTRRSTSYYDNLRQAWKYLLACAELFKSE